MANNMRTTIFMVVLAFACVASAGLFGGKSAYEMLADYLEKSTSSNQLADNIKQAASLVDQNPDASGDLKELVASFQSLSIDTNYPKSLCSRPNMFNLRRVAEAMRAGGNLGASRITPPVIRLNAMLFIEIAKIHPICAKQLETEWTREWKPNFSVKNGESNVYELRRVPFSFIEDLYMARTNWASFERLELGRALSNAISSGEKLFIHSGEPTDPEEEHPLDTENRDFIAKQLQRFVYKPCEEFVKKDLAKSVLQAYNDLRMSSYIEIYAMDKYIKNTYIKRPHLNLDKDSDSLLSWAISYQACQKVLVTPVKKLSKRVAKARNFDKRPDWVPMRRTGK